MGTGTVSICYIISCFWIYGWIKQKIGQINSANNWDEDG